MLTGPSEEKASVTAHLPKGVQGNWVGGRLTLTQTAFRQPACLAETKRIKAVLRRHYTATPTETEELIRGDLVIRPGRYEVLAMGQLVQLTRTEFRILHLLARRPGWVFTRNQIIEAAQGDDTSVTARSVDVHMVSLRRKLGSYGEAVETIRGVGYRFKDSEE